MKPVHLIAVAALLAIVGAALLWVPADSADAVLIVEESSDRTPAQAAIYVSPEARAVLPFRLIDIDQASDQIKAAIAGKPLPLCVFSREGRVISTDALPDTPAAAAALIRRRAGK